MSLSQYLFIIAKICIGNLPEVNQKGENFIYSCILAHGEETFSSPEGEAILRKWGIPDTMTARCFIILGYIDGDYPASKPHKEWRYMIIR